MSTVIVLGGGITGLSCAYYLKTLGKKLLKKIILVEQSTFLGGWLKSTRFPDGTVYEHGPRSIRVGGKPGYNTLELVDSLELSSEVLPVPTSHIAARRRLIWANNKLHVLPNDISTLVKKQEPFSKALIWYLIKDLISRRKLQPDESVHNFAERRFGKEVARYVMDPMCRGIIAGNSKEISIRSLLNVAYRAEQEHGSVMRGQWKYMKESRIESFLSNDLAMTCRKDNWSIWSLKTGLQRLPEKLTSALENDELVQLCVNVACKKIHFEDGKATVSLEPDTTIQCDHIFSCLPARNLSSLASKEQPNLAKSLALIPSVHVAVVNLEYKGKLLNEQGFGYLIPSSENSKILGGIFDSCCFPEHDGIGDEKTRITVMMGGYWFQSLFGDVDSVDPELLFRCAVESVSEQLSIDAEPVRYHVSIQKHCIPQYNVGHHAIVENVKNEIKEKKLNLSVLGASYDGVSVNDCIYNSRLEVETYLKSLQI